MRRRVQGFGFRVSGFGFRVDLCALLGLLSGQLDHRRVLLGRVVIIQRCVNAVKELGFGDEDGGGGREVDAEELCDDWDWEHLARPGTVFKFQRSGYRFGVWGLEFGVWGLGLGVGGWGWGLGVGGWGLGLGYEV